MPGLKRNLKLKRLKEVLYYNHTTGFLYWKVSKRYSIEVCQQAGCLRGDGYIVIKIDGVEYLAHRLGWFYYYGCWPENGLDHKDRIRHNNWIDNLREASVQCNARNTGNRKDNLDGVKGVTFFKSFNKWQARITVNQNLRHLGYYLDYDDAVCARLAGEQCLNWSGCDSNSPAYQYVQKMLKRSK